MAIFNSIYLHILGYYVYKSHKPTLLKMVTCFAFIMTLPFWIQQLPLSSFFGA